MKTSIYFLFLIVILAVRCNSPEEIKKNRNIPKDIAVQVSKEKIDTGNIRKITMEAALSTYKNPLRKESFDVAEGLPEGRMELYNLIQQSEFKDKPLFVEEIVWELDSVSNITVWYKKIKDQWRPIHQKIWMKGYVF